MPSVIHHLEANHPALAARLRALPECRLPVFTQPLLFNPQADWAQRARLLHHGIELTGTPGPDNYIMLDEAAPPAPRRMRLELFGGAGQLVVLEAGQVIAGHVRMEAQHQALIAGHGTPGSAFHAPSIILRDPHTLVLIGAEVSSNGAKLLVHGAHTTLSIGDDCMLANDIEISASDSHAIFDAATLQRLNPPASIRIGRHVWIGAHVSVLKGVHIGDGSIIGARSVVTRNAAAMSAYAGVPARRVRQNVTWSRHLAPDAAHMRGIVEGLARAGIEAGGS